MSDRIAKDFARPVYNFSFAFATGAATHSSCTISTFDDKGNAIGEIMPIYVWMSSSVTGEGLATVSPTNLAALATGGTYLDELTANKSAIVLTNSSGKFILDITDAVTMTDYVCAAPLAGMNSFASVSRVMSAADFGA
jgi:hypothetical protein